MGFDFTEVILAFGHKVCFHENNTQVKCHESYSLQVSSSTVDWQCYKPKEVKCTKDNLESTEWTNIAQNIISKYFISNS